jgi:alkanesulfonate monooxygenase SsuD/methylene tetrahydromethanopterin reductase-like flavin-dependent oxidoreductase (luciferase family)
MRVVRDPMPRALAVPCFADDPADLVRLGTDAERAGFSGFFLWDHLVHSGSGAGPPIVDPWQVLALVAAGTSRIALGTMITPVARRRPWKLAKETTTLDLLSNGRVILGVGLGAPPGEFSLFGESADARHRAELLDEGLDVLAGLWSGEPFSYRGKHYTVGPVAFAPVPVQHPRRMRVWVGGELPAAGPVARAARWDGFVPIHRERPDGQATPADIAAVRDKIETLRGTTANFDIAVWGELDSDGQVAAALPAYRDAGATWFIESPRSGAGWLELVRDRIRRGPEVKSHRG